MTAENGKRTRTFARRAVTQLAGIAIFVVLSSCTDDATDPGALSGTLGRADPLDVGLMTASVSPLQRSGIFIQLPAGLPNELASHLLARFQEASISKQLPLARTGTIPELTIKGVARAGAARTGTAVALVWEVLNADGKRVMLLSGDALIQRSNSNNMDLYDPWSVVDEATLEKIADAAAAELATWYSAHWIGVPLDTDSGLATASIDETPDAGPSSPPARAPIDFTTPSIIQATPSEAISQPATGSGVAARDATLAAGTSPPQPIAITSPTPVAPIAVKPPETTDRTPARVPDIPAETDLSMVAPSTKRVLFDVAVGLSPGDGQLSLAAAVQEALMEKGIIELIPPSAYRVIGDVTLAQSGAGQARIKIEWSVFTKAGTQLGVVTQLNEVTATSVAGPWGEIATAAGSAAATGIMELISAPTPPV